MFIFFLLNLKEIKTFLRAPRSGMGPQQCVCWSHGEITPGYPAVKDIWSSRKSRHLEAWCNQVYPSALKLPYDLGLVI